jgi:glycosyltransferase involved in cell wall biosynthesis
MSDLRGSERRSNGVPTDSSSASSGTVWLVAYDFEPRGRSFYTLRLTSALIERGFNVVLICRSAARLPDSIRDEATVVEAKRMNAAAFDWSTFKSLDGTAKEHPPDLVHAQRRSADRLGSAIAGRYGKPYLLTLHDQQTQDRRWRPTRRRPDAVIAVSDTVKREIGFHVGYSAERIYVIPVGIETSEHPVIPAPTDRKRPIVACASAFDRNRGVSYFLMAAEVILSSGQDVEFLVAGSGPEEGVLRRMAAKLEIANRTTFVSATVDFGDVIDLCDVFVNPSLEQGLGSVMLEAMSVGKPVVSTAVGGPAEYLIDGVHAMLAPAADHLQLAEKIQYLLDNPARARKLAVAGQALVRERFSLERTVDETIALYRSLSRAVAPTLKSPT